MFKLSNTLLAATVALFAMAGGVSAAARRDIALASNPVDACNGSNHYGVGHSCAFSTPDGTSQGTCQTDASGDLVCIPN
ncbi:hypothetical protein PENSPDRAFT_679959 [Peniophora sp. CONT]|nr:hypothetical protein PENSPDRAFT_679959 [Peniophora sp. CONT]